MEFGTPEEDHAGKPSPLPERTAGPATSQRKPVYTDKPMHIGKSWHLE
jgi:hypothetical protein